MSDGAIDVPVVANVVMGPTAEDIEAQFTYHAPTEGQPAKYQRLRDEAKQLAFTIMELCPPSADRSDAIRKLRESVMMANASIAIHD